MTTVETAQRSERTSRAPTGDRRAWVPVVLALLVTFAAARIGDPAQVAWLRNFLIVFGSLLVEAVPFVVLGAFVSAGIEVLVPASAFARIGRLPRSMQAPAAALAGVTFPVCECGSVPVARRLVAKGLAPSAAVTFMLAAPIVNPVVVASTFVAYRGRDTLWVMVGGRFLLGLVVAIVVGWVIGARRPEDLLRRAPALEAHEVDAAEPRWRRFAGHLSGDVVFMARFLIIGAAIAAAIQTFVPQTIVDGLASLPVLSLVAMMGLAFLMSLCSESDAFVAASFVSFGPGPQLAFLVFGPMVDTKLTALYIGTYSRGFFRTVLVTVAATTLVATLWIEVLFG
ncbi:MAG TPA: permease [Actinomycetota bacterium]|nr:permease [Actinomycetota bacterium]